MGYQPDATELADLPRRRHRGLVRSRLRAKVRVAVGVEAGDGRVDAVDRVVVATLAVFGLVVDRAVLDLHLADGQVALVVGLVVFRVPQAELDEAEERDRLGSVGRVGERDLVDLGVDVYGDKEQRGHFQPAARARDAGVAHAVAGLEVVEVRLVREVARAPDVAAIVDGEDATAVVDGGVVVAVAREATHLRVAVEAVSATRCAR